jgi:hypothetical protein
MVEQNLLVAISLAVLGGFFQVVSVLILAYPEHQKEVKGKDFKKPMRKVLVPINLVIQLINGAATTGAAIFGPVAIVMPVTVSAQLMFNILIFGYLEMEQFDKDVQVGTFIVVLGSALLPIVGPTVQQDQEILELLNAPYSLVWTSFLFAGVCISGFSCFACVNTNKWKEESLPVYATLTIARVFSSVLSASLSKALALVSGVPLIITIIGFLICGVVLGTSVVLQATKTEQKLFVPVISCGTQLVNAATGLILWEDWKVVQSVTGYSLVMVQIIVGVYLISSLDFFENTADPYYGMRQAVTIRNGSLRSISLRSMKQQQGGAGGDEKSKKTDTEATPTKMIHPAEKLRIDNERRKRLWSANARIQALDMNTNHNNTLPPISSRAGSPKSASLSPISQQKEFFADDEGMSSLASVASIRGLIGGNKKEPLIISYRSRSAINMGTGIETSTGTGIGTQAESLSQLDEENYDPTMLILKSMKMAEAAAKKGEERFSSMNEVDIVDFDSSTIASIPNIDDVDE